MASQSKQSDNIKNKDANKETKDSNKEKKVNEELYKTVVLNEYIYLKPTDLNFKIDNIILAKLKAKIEGKCNKAGYVIPDSIVIQTRSLGMINNASFDGITTYKVIFNCEVCNPVIGQIIQCKVGKIDKSQIIFSVVGDIDIFSLAVNSFRIGRKSDNFDF